MKVQLGLISKVTLLSAMLLVTLVASAQGQSLAYRVRANIPFDFTVGEKRLPAGEYSVGRVGQGSDIAMSITDLNGHAKAMRLTYTTVTLHPKKKASLIFHRYGDQYFLFQMWQAGAIGLALIGVARMLWRATPAEKEAGGDGAPRRHRS